MNRTGCLKVFLRFWLFSTFLFYTEVTAGPVPCNDEVFHCSNGKCTHINWLCDRGNDCGDNSDEQFCDKGPCHPYTFQCLNGKCIPRTSICDNSNDCGDNSDEQFCAAGPCHPSTVPCMNGKCVKRRSLCNNEDDCGDKSDEWYCYKRNHEVCPLGWFQCPNNERCIPSNWVCDGTTDCTGESEERNCGNIIVNTTDSSTAKDVIAARTELISWFWRRKKSNVRLQRWDSQVHRIAVALHLADDTTFSPWNSEGKEMRYELTIELLHRLIKDKKMSSQELALYIHALLVACIDPNDFYGEDLVRELRRRVEVSGNYTNPFLILVLCNAGDAMTAKDVERVSAAYDLQHRPFWTDYQTLSSMALSCISSRSREFVDERILRDMLQELKRRQFRNGTVDNFKTTALVTQAMFIHDSYKKDFDLESALRVLANGLNGNKSLMNAYYALPVFNRKSLLNVTSNHCIKDKVPEEEALQKTLNVNGETITVHYSVWMGDEVNVGRSWRLRMHANSTIYDVIENVANIDNRQKIEYNVVDGRPFVSALNGKEDDPEMGTFWFVYLKTLNSDENPKVVEESPVDIKVKPNQEIILWYKHAAWSGQS